MKDKIIRTEEELEQNWKSAYIKGVPKIRTLKTLMEAFKLGIKIHGGNKQNDSKR